MSYTNGLDKPSDYFNTVTYTGNSTARNIVTSHATNFAWLKVRNTSGDHYLFDSVRGTNNYIRSNRNDAEGSLSGTLTSFNSDGYSLGTTNATNTNGETQVGWSWVAGTSFTNDASSTGIGTIDSSGSVNTDAGFSICSFTGNGTSGASVKHGLSTKPAMMIIKNRDEADSWQVYHHKNTSAPATETLQLNETGATSDTSNRWNDTEPTTAIFTLGDNPTVNKNTIKYIGYIFSEIKGYSKFGSYTGNGNADGTFIYTGFKPAFLITKKTNATGPWDMFDNTRNVINPVNSRLHPNASDTEFTNSAMNIDFVSNGFKIKTTDNELNTSGSTYIYMAFAENPFVTSTGVPATAR